MATCVATTMLEVPESQRLITVSLSKIAASRIQKGGINLHKNLLVATVLTKARAAYMIQHIAANKQRAAMAAAPPSSSAAAASSCVEMQEQNAEPVSASSATSSSSSPSSVVVGVAAVAPSSPPHSPPSPVATPQSVTPLAETSSSVPEGAADSGSSMQVSEEECEDKENTPPPPPPSSSPSPSDCEKRLQGDVDSAKDWGAKQGLSSRASSSHGQHHTTTTTSPHVVNRPSSTCCLLKRRRAMDRDHENVSAPKVRIVEVSLDNSSSSCSSSPEPMQCDSPQISNLVNIFNTGFAGLSGPAASSVVGQSILSSVSTHKLSDNLTCAKEIKAGLDAVHQPLVLSV